MQIKKVKNHKMTLTTTIFVPQTRQQDASAKQR